jgi:hypothetical protein
LAETQQLTAAYLVTEAAGRVPWEEPAGGKELRTGGENFFSQPPIIREEALFLGIDKFCSPAGKKKAENPVPVKRSNLRSFSRGDCAALDLGCCRIRKTASHVIISGGKTGGEAGFSLLIKAPGLYKLKGVTIELLPGFSLQNEEASAEGFFVSLPLVIRQTYHDDCLVLPDRKIRAADLKQGAGFLPLCAVDAWGLAAFISTEAGKGALVSHRGMPGGLGESRGDESGGFGGICYCRILCVSKGFNTQEPKRGELSGG